MATTGATTTDTASTWTVEKTAIVVGLTLGWVLGLAGVALADTAREVAWVISSIGIMAAGAALAVRHIDDVPLASGFALLAIGEAVIHTQGSAGPDAVAAATYAYIPALLLVAASAWSPTWVRFTAAASGLAFGVHAVLYLAGQEPLVDGPAAGAGYGLLALSMIGWTLKVVRNPA